MKIKTKWEYTVRRPYGYICTHPPKDSRARGETAIGNIEAYFNQMGNMGWEMCGTGDDYYYFKRQIEIE